MRALLSVSDKTGVVEFCKKLSDFSVELISTGGTASTLKQHQIPVTEVSDVTKFPEILDGRVKTLHPHIHAGILARGEQDKATLDDLKITPIDLVIVNLYPFQETIKDPNCDLATAVEKIDIGGPTMLRAAAKNFAHVAVVVDPADYDLIIEELETNGKISHALRFKLTKKAFAHTAQ